MAVNVKAIKNWSNKKPFKALNYYQVYWLLLFLQKCCNMNSCLDFLTDSTNTSISVQFYSKCWDCIWLRLIWVFRDNSRWITNTTHPKGVGMCSVIPDNVILLLHSSLYLIPLYLMLGMRHRELQAQNWMVNVQSTGF